MYCVATWRGWCWRPCRGARRTASRSCVASRSWAAGHSSLKEGTLYPVLYRLEEAGLVQAAWEDDSSGRRGPRRRIYRLNEKGESDLARRRADWEHFVTIVGGILGAPA